MVQVTLIVVFAMLGYSAAMEDVPVIYRIRKCFAQEYSMLCFKEEILDILNRTINSRESYRFADLVDIERDPEFISDQGDEELPTDLEERNAKLNELLYKKAEEYFQSRSVRFHFGNVVEGRGKKKGGGGGGGKTGMMAMVVLVTTMAQSMMTGKAMMMAILALVVAKMAMMMCGMGAMKKILVGGETKHIVYTQELGGGGGGGGGGYGGGGYGGGGGGGGWGRSLIIPPTSHEIVYRAHVPSSKGDLESTRKR